MSNSKLIFKGGGGKGPIGALVRRGGCKALTSDQKASVDALKKKEAEALNARLERLATAMDVCVACDYSGSTSALHASLKAIAVGLKTSIVGSYPSLSLVIAL
jgi:translation initiation factor IF-2